MSTGQKENADIGAYEQYRAKCPKCGSSDYIPIVHGYPTHEAFEKAERGELILAGCCVFEPNPPNKSCKKCHHQFR